jgi:N-acetylglucosamine-6-phosphate deacetylase
VKSALRSNACLLAVFVFTLTSQFAQVMCNATLAHDLLTADSTAATTVRSGPTLIEHVSGYTLAANKLLTFSAMVFDAGKVVAAGDAKDLRYEQRIGSLEPGRWADFILVDRDLFKIAPADIWKIKVQQTWVGGRRVY